MSVAYNLSLKMMTMKMIMATMMTVMMVMTSANAAIIMVTTMKVTWFRKPLLTSVKRNPKEFPYTNRSCLC